MKRALTLCAVVALAACSQSEPSGENAGDFASRVNGGGATGPGQPAASVAEINAQPVVAPSGAAQLTPLSADAPKSLGAIAGGCSFVYQGRSLFVAGAPKTEGAAGNGVLVADGQQVVVGSSETGGPQTVTAGPTMSGSGYTVTVMRADGAGQANNGHTEWTAGLTVSGPKGETVFSPGTWSCTA